MNKLIRRLKYLLNRRRLDQELAREMEFHREMAAHQNISAVPLGNALRLREESRDAWGWTWLDRLAQDLRYTARILRKSPGFTVTAVLMLALGIGVNVAAFGFFNLMVLRPLPVRNPAAILFFERTSREGRADNFIYPEVAFYREHAKALSAVWAAAGSRLSFENEPNPINVSLVTANFFQELGAAPAAGRLFDPRIDEAHAVPPVVVLSYSFWQSHFAADPSIIGKTIRLNNKPLTIVGVASRLFSGLGTGGSSTLWIPISQAPYTLGVPNVLNDFTETGMSVQMWGRLQPGATPKAAESELSSLAAELHRQQPNNVWKDEALLSGPGGYAVKVRPEMYPLLALATALGILILAAACITLGNLLLAKGEARNREISIRSAIGASRLRLVRQLFTESLALSALGTAAGLFLGYSVLRGLMLWTGSPAWLNPSPDWRVIAFALAAGLTATLLFGLTPALQVARQKLQRTRLRQFLVSAQIAASCILLIVAGLLIRALQHAISHSPGFAYENIISLDPNFHSYTPAQATAYWNQLQTRLQSVPGVASISLASNPPLGHRWTVGNYTISGHRVDIHFNHIDSQFFQTMSIPLLAGRVLRAQDKDEVVISETLARLAWPNENPLGKQLKSAGNATIVGICGNAHLVSPEDSDAVEVYQSAQPDIMPSMVMLIRTTRPTETMAPLIASLTKPLDQNLFPTIELLKSAYQQKLDQARYAALTVVLLGIVALLLACIGIFGLTIYVVSQRTKEIGIRMALGAQPSAVLAVILRQFTIPVFTGLSLGLAGAAALSQILRQQLYGLSSFDPIAYSSSVAFFALAVALAALLPAKRALRIDPTKSLRYD